MNRVLAMLSLVLVGVTPGVAPAQHGDHVHAPSLGVVAFSNSGNNAAQAPLQRGVALLHSFEYDDAAAAFRQAQAADRGLAVAYWLEALTYSHILWGEEDLPKSRAALQKLAATPEARLARAKTARERSFGAAVEALFRDGTLNERGLAYAESVIRHAEADTADLEAKAFAAHASMVGWFTRPAAQRAGWDQRARHYAQSVFDANPDHPGAAHYLIHYVDMNPDAAAAMLKYARIYDKIAPDAEHALHMPSHVYLPLGLWPEVAASNERAWKAQRAWVREKKRPADENGWHDLDWLQYAYLQQGRLDDARVLIDTAAALLKGIDIPARNPDARYIVNLLAFRYGWESGRWDAYPDGLPQVETLLAQPRPTPRATGMGNVALYQAAVAALYGKRDRGAAETVIRVFRSAADSTGMSPAGAANLRRIATQLEALLAREAGDLERAITLLTEIAPHEPANVSLPPTIIPSYELLGDVLLQAGRKDAAVNAYKRALELRPNRRQPMLGLERAQALEA